MVPVGLAIGFVLYRVVRMIRHENEEGAATDAYSRAESALDVGSWATMSPLQLDSLPRLTRNRIRRERNASANARSPQPELSRLARNRLRREQRASASASRLKGDIDVVESGDVYVPGLAPHGQMTTTHACAPLIPLTETQSGAGKMSSQHEEKAGSTGNACVLSRKSSAERENLSRNDDTIGGETVLMIGTVLDSMEDLSDLQSSVEHNQRDEQLGDAVSWESPGWLRKREAQRTRGKKGEARSWEMTYQEVAENHVALLSCSSAGTGGAESSYTDGAGAVLSTTEAAPVHSSGMCAVEKERVATGTEGETTLRIHTEYALGCGAGQETAMRSADSEGYVKLLLFLERKRKPTVLEYRLETTVRKTIMRKRMARKK